MHGFYLICSYRVPRKARANNVKLKSARNEHKMKALNNAYEVKYSAPLFLSSLCRIFAITEIKKCFCHPLTFARSLGEC